MSDDIKNLFKKMGELSESNDNVVNLHDNFDLELSEHFVIETEVIGFEHDGVIVEADEATLEFLDLNGVLLEAEHDIDESNDYYPKSETNPVSNIIGKNTVIGKYEPHNGMTRVGHVYEFSPKGREFLEIRWNNGKYSTENINELRFLQGPYMDKTVGEVFKSLTSKLHDLSEAEYQGKKVSLNKPFLTPDGPKKRSVYVKKPNGKVVKVNFGSKEMRIKKSNPERRKSFRARHKCATAKDRTSARYWSCKFW
jgi:hypothetical protein